MRKVQTGDLSPLTMPTSETEKLHIYNGLDCCLTGEIFEVLEPQLDNLTRAKYEFSKSLMGPVLEMNMRGVLVDQEARTEAISLYEADIQKIQFGFDEILSGAFGMDLNWRSPHQLKKLFYEIMGIPPVKHQGKVTTRREALEKLDANYFLAKPIVKHILAMRDMDKKVQALRTEVDYDGRIRSSFNIAGTNTGRFSSSENIYGAGGNLQNIEERLRRIFIADPGCKFAYIDLEQAESRLVGAIIWNLFGDSKYLDACETGDLHTTVAKLCFPNLPWANDQAKDKALADDTIFYRQHSHRHMCKVLGHGTNYLGTPFTMAQHTKIEPTIIKAFQGTYFGAFPGIPRWHEWVKNEIFNTGMLVSLMGRKRHFFGRRDDDSTIREAVAFDPQGSVADILNTAMLRVWKENFCHLLMQVHDAILIQYPEEKEDEILPRALKLCEVPIELANGRTLLIPSEAKVGWNWSNFVDEATAVKEKKRINLDGLKKFKGHDDRKRTPTTAILDRRISDLHP